AVRKQDPLAGPGSARRIALRLRRTGFTELKQPSQHRIGWFREGLPTGFNQLVDIEVDFDRFGFRHGLVDSARLMESHNIYLSILLSNAGFRPKREGRARPDGTPAADFQNLKKR